jgi:hypothetical protein
LEAETHRNAMPSTWKIYGLVDPRHRLYYIGKTVCVLEERLDEYFFESCDTLVSKTQQPSSKAERIEMLI